MKIMIVMGGFFPGKKYGGPPVSVDNFCSLMSEYECFIVTRDHDLFETERYSEISDGWNNRGNCKVMYLSDANYNYTFFEKSVLETKPDVIYLQGLFQSCIFPCLRLAKKHHIKVLIAPRGELCEGALNIKKYKKIPYIKAIRMLGLTKNIHWQSTSDEETNAISRYMKADTDHIHFLNNIPSISNEYVRRDYKKNGAGHFVFISRIHPKKNLLSAIKYFYKIQGKAYFDIYGPVEDQDYWNLCLKEINMLPSNIVVEYKGILEHKCIHSTFARYDAFLFPTMSENYGHVIAESINAGIPVVISDRTPWKNLDAKFVGWVCNLNDDTQFISAIQQIIDMNEDEWIKMHNNALQYSKEYMDTSKILNEYISAFDYVIGR